MVYFFLDAGVADKDGLVETCRLVKEFAVVCLVCRKFRIVWGSESDYRTMNERTEMQTFEHTHNT
jgi:hypothetical protein